MRKRIYGSKDTNFYCNKSVFVSNFSKKCLFLHVKKKNSTHYMVKKLLKWTGFAVLTPLLLIGLLAALFYFPPFQNWAVKQVAAYASERTGWEISVEQVHLSFPLDLSVEGVKVLQKDNESGGVIDTLLDARQVIADVQLLPLFRGQVEVDALAFHQTKLNTDGLIPDLRIKGQMGLLSVESHGIDLRKEDILVNSLSLADATVDVVMTDTVPPDTTKSEPVRWKVFVEKMDLQRTSLRLFMPDTTLIAVSMKKTSIADARIDLAEKRYEVRSLDMNDGKFAYGQQQFDFRKLKTGILLADNHLRLTDIDAQTGQSKLQANFDMDLNAFDKTNPGQLSTQLKGSFSKQDLMKFITGLPKNFWTRWPDQPLSVDGVVKGNLQRAWLHNVNVKLPTAFTIQTDGEVGKLMETDSLSANLNIHAVTQNLGFVKSLLDASAQKTLNIPSHMQLDGILNIDGRQYASNFTLREGRGLVKGTAKVNTDKMKYDINLQAQALQLQHFLPGQPLQPFTGTVRLHGQGTDMLATSTGLNADIDVLRFKFAGISLDQVKATAIVKNGVTHAHIVSTNPLWQGVVNVSGLSNGKRMQATLSCDLPYADLYSLGLAKDTLTIGLCAHLDIESDLGKYYMVQGLISDISVRDSILHYRPDDIVLDAMTDRDTTRAVIDCGDFHLDLHAHGGYEELLNAGSEIAEEVVRQYDDRTIDQVALREKLPLARINLSSGNDNFFIRMLQHYGCSLSTLNLHMNASPVAGINGLMNIGALTVDSILLDTINFSVKSDSTRISYQAQVRNNKQNPQYTFNALFDGIIYDKGTILGTRLYDDRDQLGVRMGIRASMENDGFMFRFYGPDPTLGYKEFKVNEGNYVFLGPDRRVSADVKLLAADGMGVQIYSNDEDSTALQDITFSLNKFDLEKVLDVIPYTPNLSGMLNGDFHIIQNERSLSVSTNLSVDNMAYEGSPMGDLSTEFVYIPMDNGGHYVDGLLHCNDQQVATISGTYLPEGGGQLDADLQLERFPLSLSNGFVPRGILGLRGYGEGTLSVKGRLSAPVIDGELLLDSAYIYSEPYGVTLRFDNDPVAISHSRLLLENFNMYAINEQPLTTAGYIDFANPDHIYMKMRMRAQNFQVINAKENVRSEAFGKAYVNFFGMMDGELDNLSMRGRLDVLGSTDMTYILRDSPLTTDNHLDELVKFTDFSDTTTVNSVKRPPLTGFNMDLTLSIDESAHILCALNADRSNYVDLIGGGELRMLYNPTENLRLTGRYTLSNGEMKYSLPVIPLKTFTIQNGSYIEFTGDIMNPRLNITATERAKAGVATEGSQSRMVEFDCGVVITKTLKDMGLEFIIDAPQDMEISNQLNTMSKEERGKIAVTMLTTGMYLSDGNTNAFSMNSALSAFLNSQINGIAGNALRTLDLSFGMDNATDASGNIHTDYSFKFSKRLWDNRLRVIIGGKLSTGSDVSSQNQTFFNNVQFEYRLNESSSQFLKLFYNRDSYDWLEGAIGQYGAGFIWRRKLSHFQDLFRFKEQTIVPPTMQKQKPNADINVPSDSISTRQE